jgi:hypothetical protein
MKEAKTKRQTRFLANLPYNLRHFRFHETINLKQIVAEGYSHSCGWHDEIVTAANCCLPAPLPSSPSPLLFALRPAHLFPQLAELLLQQDQQFICDVLKRLKRVFPHRVSAL